jgi:hypothetical protein
MQGCSRGALAAAGVCLAFAVVFDPAALAQREAVVPPPARFASAEEHYNALLKKANGGTRHTLGSLPDWSGIWQSGIATMSMNHPVDAPLSPVYRAGYQEKQRQEREVGEVYYDRRDGSLSRITKSSPWRRNKRG